MIQLEGTRVRRDRIGFVFQFLNLPPTLTSLENVRLPFNLRGWANQSTGNLDTDWTGQPTVTLRDGRIAEDALR